MRYIVLLLVLLIGAGFVFINWPAVNAPVEVNLLITTAKAPITLMLLFWFSLLFVIVIYILFVQQTGSFATMRRLTKELQEQRKLATDQEASRLTDVKADFEKKWQIWMEEQKQILSQTEQRLSDRQKWSASPPIISNSFFSQIRKRAAARFFINAVRCNCC